MVCLQFAHENITAIHTVFVDDKNMMLSLEFIGGGELFDTVAQCVCERDIERECVCARACVCACVCVCVWKSERLKLCVREREPERDRMRETERKR